LTLYKKLAGQTIIYGLGTIVPKILNYSILTVYYTRLFRVEEFGVITELYAYVTFLMIILTYGTETGFFRFAADDKRNIVFSSLLVSLATTSTIFFLGVFLFRNKIAAIMEYSGNIEYIVLLALIVAIDAFCTIPFAKIRREEKAIKFSLLKVTNVAVTIILVILFYEILPGKKITILPNIVLTFNKDVVFVLIANLIASSVILILLLPDILENKILFDWKILKEILSYSFPLLIAGLAGTINETLDRVLMKHLITDHNEAMYALGIYGANYRIAAIMFIFIQMFRYAAEPFYFNYYGKKDYQEVFSKVMRLFIGVSIAITMIMLFYIDYVKYFISKRYHEGLLVVPIVLTAYVFYGIFFNLSIWYKLLKKTIYAIVLTGIGATITILANVMFVGKFSYFAAAFGHLIAYSTMMIVSFLIGRKYLPIDYKLNRILEYFGLALIIFAIRFLVIDKAYIVLRDGVSLIMIIIYLAIIIKREGFKIKGFWKYEGTDSEQIET
jgi:O-antigen/teichoic acid export membrane protein